MRSYYISIFLVYCTLSLPGQSGIDLQLLWEEHEGEQLVLQGEGYDAGNLPVVFRRIPLSGDNNLRVKLILKEEKRYRSYNPPHNLTSEYEVRTYTEYEQGQPYGTIYVYPMRRNGHGDVTVLLAGRLEVSIIPGRPRLTTRSGGFTNESVLSEGELLKIPITRSGIHRINFDQLPESWTGGGFTPERVQLFAGHPGPLPYEVGDPKVDDLRQVPYYLDGAFTNVDDGIIFFADGPHIKTPSQEDGYLTIRHNVYSDTNFYYLRYGVENGLQMVPPANLETPPSTAAESGADVWRYEEDNYNILEGILQGSGRTWYTDAFTGTVNKDYGSLIKDLPIISDRDVLFSAAFAGRSDFRNTVTFEVGNQTYNSDMFAVEMSDRYGIAARLVSVREELQLSQKRLNIRHQTQQSNSRGWLDFLEIAFDKELEYKDAPLEFFTYDNISAYRVTNARQGLLAMDVTDPFGTHLLPSVQQNNEYWFESATDNTGKPGHYVVFDPNQVTTVPDLLPLSNQNLHAIQSVDYLIVYHPLFFQSVKRLADHRRQHNGFDVELVNIKDIYNEYSSGKTDPSALRNFLKMLYSRGNKDIRVLLFGDGSFDYKLNSELSAYADESFIPVFETENSHNPIRAFPSDDYYALLDDREGEALKGALDISIGRIPVRTPAEADVIVQKILTYETNPETLGDWRQDMLLVADDGNFNLFLGYTERLSNNVEQEAPQFKITKAYVDASQNQIAPNGTLSPRTNAIINNSAFEGQLIINYQGHGSSKGWADEAILSKSDLEKWNNSNKYPVLVTATCTFAGYDDPKEVTAGEYSLILPDKGSIALFTTTRVVYANSNDRLTTSLFERLMERMDDPPELGEWIRLAKNANRSDTLDINSRKFTLLGDPAMKIAIPRYMVIVSEINGKDPFTVDSIRIGALGKVSIKGYIADHQGNVQSNFNGELSPTLFDKKKILETLGQGNDNYPEQYDSWQNVIYKGRASVSQGEFQFEFIVPRDIDYTIGPGRLIMYANDGIQSDAWGLGENILVGGTADNPIENDQKGPEIEAWLGDKNFMNGDEIDPNSLLLLYIEDASGINVSGNGIGHDLIYYLDDKVESATVLNNYFNYDLNSYSKGSVEFPLDNLEPGKHSLTIKVWDSYNNLSEKTVEFYVNKQELAVKNVLNYPNPFFDQTEFQFENPLIGDDLAIVIDIYTPSGRLAHRILENRNSSGQLIRGIYWDGRDQWKQKLANGVYIYKIKIVEQTGNKTTQLHSEFQKLLLLN